MVYVILFHVTYKLDPHKGNHYTTMYSPMGVYNDTAIHSPMGVYNDTWSDLDFGKVWIDAPQYVDLNPRGY